MTTTKTKTLFPIELHHLSHSQHTSYLRCPHAYFLERVAKAPAVPAWWFLGGSTVHYVTEMWERLNLSSGGVEIDFDTKRITVNVLDDLVEQERIKKNIPYDEWFAAGRWPAKNGYDWWAENAPIMVQRYIDWRKSTNWEIAFFNDVPGIECDLSVEFDFGLFTGAPDRVFRLPSGQLVVGDVKSGSTLPTSPLQLGTYANMLEMLGHERPAYGTFVMLKKDPKEGEEVHTPLVPLDKYTTPYLESLYGATKSCIELGAFSPNPGDACRTCVVQKGCYAYGGELAGLFDPMSPNYQGSN